MNREIKFRAWDSARKTMHTSPKWVEFRVDGEGKLKAINYHPNGDEQRLPIMQFTGLQDVNGVDIYGGDVLRLEQNKHYWVYVVSTIEGFGQNLFACEVENNLSADYELNRFTFQKQYVKLGSKRDFINSRMKVIGNIYQNPELLK